MVKHPRQKVHPPYRKKQYLGKWTEYCEELYNYELNTNDNIPRTPPQNENADTPILRTEVEEAIRKPKTQKFPGNISDSKTQEDMEQKQHQNGNKDTTL